MKDSAPFVSNAASGK